MILRSVLAIDSVLHTFEPEVMAAMRFLNMAS